jgi:heme a synthase
MSGVLGWRRSPTALVRLALASVVGNVAIVVTGGAVRLTNSGLGCPTWPSCDRHSLTPTRENAVHGLIEFANRTFTGVLAVVALATLLAAWSQRRSMGLALAAFLIIPAQAVVGGITVLTHLNPWIVACHFLVSMASIAVTLCLLHAVAERQPRPGTPGPVRTFAVAIVGLTAAVLVLGTVVTGSGPHAGDVQHGRIRRTGLDPGAVAHLHADVVMILIGLTAGLALTTRLLSGPAGLRRAVWFLLTAELGQGVIGFVQYFTHLPVAVVALHLLGACAVWLAALEVLLQATPRRLDPSGPDADDGRPVARSDRTILIRSESG